MKRTRRGERRTACDDDVDAQRAGLNAGVGEVTESVETAGIGAATSGVGVATVGVGTATTGSGAATLGVGVATVGVGVASSRMYAGLSRSRVTFTAWPLISKVKVRSSRAVTANGPEYDGWNGGRTVSSRTQTWLHDAKSLKMKVERRPW